MSNSEVVKQARKEFLAKRQVIEDNIGSIGASLPPSRLVEGVDDDALTLGAVFLQSSKYERLGRRLYDRFTGKVALQDRYLRHELETTRQYLAKPNDKEGVYRGHMVAVRALAHAGRAFALFAHEERLREGEALEQLDLGLRKPSTMGNLLLTLANHPDDFTLPHESIYGLDLKGFRDLYIARGGTSAVYDQSRGEFDYHPELKELAAEETGDLELEPGEEYARCPAARLYIPRLWQELVTIGLEDPTLFRADLAATSNG